MNLSPTAQATLLLTSYFSKASTKEVKPLTNKEWGQFALWLKDKSITPADLLQPDPQSLLSEWSNPRISLDRLILLLNRGHSLALAMEKWQRAGLWVLTRSDPDYPWQLKKRLRTDAPPVLFGCGNKKLLNAGGLAVVGSRNASASDLSFTDQVGAKAASESIAIVSGGARGVDETSMLGALQRGGFVVGVMADSLLKAATSAKWRKGLMDNNLVLVSPFYPEAGFNAGNAMSRNKYIYCLAESSLVIHSGKKGGTLNGAEENLKKEWVPLWVKPTNDKDAANEDLVKKGGRWCQPDIQNLRISELLQVQPTTHVGMQGESGDLFATSPTMDLFSDSQPDVCTEVEKTKEVEETSEKYSSDKEETDSSELSEELNLSKAEFVDFYQIFIGELQRLASSPVSLDELLESTLLHKSQLNEWLKQAVDDDLVTKLTRPVRYQIKQK
jgi:predicted Rossmann fold nucleotide-binding protein DprA/Smf involved in DNA uptake